MKRTILFIALGICIWLLLLKSAPRESMPDKKQSSTASTPSLLTQGTSSSSTLTPRHDKTPIPDDEEDEDEELTTRSNEELITALSLLTPTPTPTVTSPSAALTPTVQAEEEIADRFGPSESAEPKPETKRSRGGPPYMKSQTANTETLPELTAAPTETTGLSRVSGQPRGFVMLYLMHPKARDTVERQINILLDSQVQDLYLSVLVDGTFGQNFEYLNEVIRRLNTENRTLTLALYLVSGPTMRRYAKPYVDTPFAAIEPGEFRWMIEEDPKIREAVRSIAQKAKSSFDLNRSLNNGNQNFAIPMLEDNLDLHSYRVMRALVSDVLGNSAIYMRNPCIGCYDGNDSDAAGDSLELHHLDHFHTLESGDAFTLDGLTVAYPGEDAEGKISIVKLRSMLNHSVGKNHRFFGLWRAQRQGVNGPLTNPDSRTYEVPTEEQRSLEISLLRQGLIPVVENAEAEDDALLKIPTD